MDNETLHKYISDEIGKLNKKMHDFEKSAALDRMNYWCWSAMELAYRDVLNKLEVN
jgi:hypothetical protein